MSFSGQNPNCFSCKSNESELWEKTDSGDILCDKCYETQQHGAGPGAPVLLASGPPHPTPLPAADPSQEPSTDPVTEDQSSAAVGESALTKDGRLKTTPGAQMSRSNSKDLLETKSWTRKSSRIKPLKSKSQTAAKAQATKGRSRRVVFKKKPMKAPSASATIITSNHIFYQGFYWQVGDIVSVVDDDDGSLYYAQLRGFLQDAYNEKSAVITWLIPTALSPAVDFDPSTYILGPEEDVPRKMEYFEFVCHAPSDYFHSHNSPYDNSISSVEPGFIWTRIKTEMPPKFGDLDQKDAEIGQKFISSKLGHKDLGNHNDSVKRQATKVERKLK